MLYSDRPFAPAVAFPENSGKGKKTEAERTSFCFRKKYQKEKTGNGRPEETVLVEGTSRRFAGGDIESGDEPVQWTGRTEGNKVVNFTVEGENAGAYDLTGRMIPVLITDGFAHSIRGHCKNFRFLEGRK